VPTVPVKGGMPPYPVEDPPPEEVPDPVPEPVVPEVLLPVVPVVDVEVDEEEPVVLVVDVVEVPEVPVPEPEVVVGPPVGDPVVVVVVLLVGDPVVIARVASGGGVKLSGKITYTSAGADIYLQAKRLFTLAAAESGISLDSLVSFVGLSVYGLRPNVGQLYIFDKDRRQEVISRMIDKLDSKYGSMPRTS
jgi:hypothetical protein